MVQYNLISFLVIASFRGTVPHGLSLEIGDTVQILEKCDGKCWKSKQLSLDKRLKNQLT